MSKQSRSFVLALLTIVAALPTGAQKKAPVKLTHPPSFGAALAGKRILVVPGKGDCGAEFAALLLSDLASHQVRLVTPEEATALAAASGAGLDATKVAELESRTGPMVQLAVEATRCEAHQLAQMLGVGLPAPHISRTEGHFQATLRVLDPATGKELAAQALRAEAYKDNQSVTGAPEYPSQGEVKSATLARAVADAQRLYRPWTETREIAFLDDKECNLKEAFDQLKAGDREAAMRAARASADTCPAGSKAAAGAQYNLGVLLMGERKYEQALAAFAQSQKLGGRKFVAEIASECQHDKELADAAKPPLPFLPKEAGQTGIVMTNEFVVKLVQANVDEGEIVKMIAAQPAKFALKPGDLLKLKDAGVPDEIVGAMLNKK